MTHSLRNQVLAMATVTVLALAPAVAQKKKKQKGTTYGATMVGVRGMVGASSHPITIRVYGQTSDEQVNEYLEIIREGKKGELRRVLEKVKGIGRINADGRVGTEMAVVRERQTENGKLINIVTARNLPFIELYISGRTVDYPFSVVQLMVDENGKGQGSVILAARIRFNAEGALEIESYGLQPFQLVNVRTY